MLCTFSAFNINIWAKINTFHSSDEHLMLLLSSRKHRLNKDNYKREQNRNICQSVVSPSIHQFVFIFHVVQGIFEMFKVKAYLFICLLWEWSYLTNWEEKWHKTSYLIQVSLCSWFIDKFVLFYPKYFAEHLNLLSIFARNNSVVGIKIMYINFSVVVYVNGPIGHVERFLRLDTDESDHTLEVEHNHTSFMLFQTCSSMDC